MQGAPPDEPYPPQHHHPQQHRIPGVPLLLPGYCILLPRLHLCLHHRRHRKRLGSISRPKDSADAISHKPLHRESRLGRSSCQLHMPSLHSSWKRYDM